jgi:hypothetical protein
MIYHNVTQASPEWHILRKGVPTASNFDRIMTPKQRKLSSSVDGYIADLIGDKFSLYGPENPQSYLSSPMRHGTETEEEARRFYCLEKGLELHNGGFCLTDDGRFGASPDSLVGDDGCLELKCPQAGTQAAYLLDGGLPVAYLCQVHGQLIVTGRTWVDFLSYHPGLPPHLVRVTSDDFTTDLQVALDMFWKRYVTALTKIGRMR